MLPGEFRILPGLSTVHSVCRAQPVPEQPGGREMGLRATRVRELGPGISWGSAGDPAACGSRRGRAVGEWLRNRVGWGACNSVGFCIERFCFFSINSVTPVVFKPGQKRSCEEPLYQQQPQGIESSDWDRLGKWANVCLPAPSRAHGCAQKLQPTHLGRRISQSGQQARDGRGPVPGPHSPSQRKNPLTVRARWTTRNVSTQLVRNRA